MGSVSCKPYIIIMEGVIIGWSLAKVVMRWVHKKNIKETDITEWDCAFIKCCQWKNKGNIQYASAQFQGHRVLA